MILRRLIRYKKPAAEVSCPILLVRFVRFIRFVGFVSLNMISRYLNAPETCDSFIVILILGLLFDPAVRVFWFPSGLQYAKRMGLNPVLDSAWILFITSEFHCGCFAPLRNSSILHPLFWLGQSVSTIFQCFRGSLPPLHPTFFDLSYYIHILMQQSLLP